MKCTRCQKELEPGQECYTYKGGPPYCSSCKAKGEYDARRIAKEPWPNQYHEWRRKR